MTELEVWLRAMSHAYSARPWHGTRFKVKVADEDGYALRAFTRARSGELIVARKFVSHERSVRMTAWDKAQELVWLGRTLDGVSP